MIDLDTLFEAVLLDQMRFEARLNSATFESRRDSPGWIRIGLASATATLAAWLAGEQVQFDRVETDRRATSTLVVQSCND